MAKFKIRTQDGYSETVEGRFMSVDAGVVLIFGEPADCIVAAYAQPQEVRRLPAVPEGDQS